MRPRGEAEPGFEELADHLEGAVLVVGDAPPREHLPRALGALEGIDQVGLADPRFPQQGDPLGHAPLSR
ncbi:hypothetical protein D3C86_1705870 [compost metagenome]